MKASQDNAWRAILWFDSLHSVKIILDHSLYREEKVFQIMLTSYVGPLIELQSGGARADLRVQFSTLLM